jgi:flagellar hook-basal body complex protein FliE
MNVNGSSMNINQVLNQIRVRSQYMSALQEQGRTERTDFAALLKNSIEDVSRLQANSGELKAAYERGDESIDLPQVMIASQQASLSFEAVVEVRNRVLNAYQEIMNMQV